MLLAVPKVWGETIEAHRREVRDAIFEATLALAEELGITEVSMSHVAERAGIGRATLYKYFTSVDAILRTWHEQQVASHLDELERVADSDGAPDDRLSRVLERYALIQHEHHGSAIAAHLHAGAHIHHARRRLEHFVEELVRAAAEAGTVRADVSPVELARFCLHALDASSSAATKAAVRRLVDVTVRGMRADITVPHPDKRPKPRPR
jgi:AcrR family transcriptional regulator